MSSRIHAWAADAAKAPLKPFEYDPGPLGAEQVEIAVEHCGVCHSDLSMLDNEWGNGTYPLVPGHEAALGGYLHGVGEPYELVQIFVRAASLFEHLHAFEQLGVAHPAWRALPT